MQRARLVVIACMDNARIALSRSLRHVVGRFQDNCMQVITAELPCNGTAYASRPDDRDIINLSTSKHGRIEVSEGCEIDR